MPTIRLAANTLRIVLTMCIRTEKRPSNQCSHNSTLFRPQELWFPGKNGSSPSLRRPQRRQAPKRRTLGETRRLPPSGGQRRGSTFGSETMARGSDGVSENNCIVGPAAWQVNGKTRFRQVRADYEPLARRGRRPHTPDGRVWSVLVWRSGCSVGRWECGVDLRV